MKKTSKIILLALGAFILFILVAALIMILVPRPGDILQVQSDDSNIELIFNRNSLPADTDAGSISIRKIMPRELPAAFDEDAVLAAYAFEPGGLTFARPASLNVTIQNTDTTIPHLLHISEKKIETFENVDVTVDADRKMVFSTNISHFSYLIAVRGYFRIDVEDQKDHNVSETFPKKVGITRLKNSSTFTLSDGSKVDFTITDEANVTGLLSTSNPSVINPVFQGHVPVDYYVPLQKPYEGSANFTCTGPGISHFIYEVGISLRQKIAYAAENKPFFSAFELSDAPYNSFYKVRVDSKSFECKTAPMTNAPSNSLPTATPTPTPTPNPNTVEIDVLIMDLQAFPLLQFQLEAPDLCKVDHYHSSASTGGLVFSLEYQSKLEPQDPCGFGPVKDILKETRSMDIKEWEAFLMKSG